MKHPVCTGGLPVPLCTACASPLKRDEIAITRRLIGRGITQYYCIPCLASRLGVSDAVIVMKIEEYRALGCALFCTAPKTKREE